MRLRSLPVLIALSAIPAMLLGSSREEVGHSYWDCLQAASYQLVECNENTNYSHYQCMSTFLFLRDHPNGCHQYPYEPE